jgi:hypothetical protein
MEESKGPMRASDDTAAFQRFYADGDQSESESRGFLYRAFIGWWRDRR